MNDKSKWKKISIAQSHCVTFSSGADDDFRSDSRCLNLLFSFPDDDIVRGGAMWALLIMTTSSIHLQPSKRRWWWSCATLKVSQRVRVDAAAVQENLHHRSNSKLFSCVWNISKEEIRPVNEQIHFRNEEKLRNIKHPIWSPSQSTLDGERRAMSSSRWN